MKKMHSYIYYDYLGRDTFLNIYPSDHMHHATLGNGVGQFRLHLPWRKHMYIYRATDT